MKTAEANANKLVKNPPTPWWKSAVVYQIYPRSFRDTTGSGTGDLVGIKENLGHIQALGVDAIWLSPFYPSPQVDAGYDVSDYCDVDPMFGTLSDFDDLLETAHGLGLRVIIDLVPNHCSNQHPLFQAAITAKPGSDERNMFHFVDAQEDSELPPNNWTSVFGGPSWTRVFGSEGEPDQWYYHLFAPEQPDFNWENPKVLAFFEDVIRFWLDRGVDGFRIDVSDALIKDTSWPNTNGGHPVIPKDESSPVHEIYRQLRKVLDSYDRDRMAVIETGAPDEEVALFLRPGQMHQAFNFRFLKTPWNAHSLGTAIAQSLVAFENVGAPTTWVTDNHDSIRSLTRYAKNLALDGAYVPDEHLVSDQTSPLTDGFGEAQGRDLGEDRARAMALLLLTLPGSAYIYMGQELGLPEVLDLPESSLTDPVFFRSQGKQRGRDGCRVPLPWSENAPSYGFTSGSPWLPQPESWGDFAVSNQQSDPTSMLTWYQQLLELRADEPALGTGKLEWILDPDDPKTSRIHFRLHPHEAAEQGRVLDVVVNFGEDPIPLPPGEVLACSAKDLKPGFLPADASAILTTQSPN